jgi:SAM-dependent methyltransferase
MIARPKSIARLSLERELEEVLRDIEPGRLLDVGAKGQPYRALVKRCTGYISLDIAAHPGVDIVGDIHKLAWRSGDFDTILMTEVLEHLQNPQRAVDEVHRLLKNGGKCILTTRFFHPYHADPHDYFRFTESGLMYLFGRFENVEVRPLGNRIYTVWLSMFHGRDSKLGRIIGHLSPLIFRLSRTADSRWACGFLVVGTKKEDAGEK